MAVAGMAGLAFLLSCSPRVAETADRCVITVRPGDSLQQAVDGATPGAVICLPRGTWTETLVITKPLTLRGAGPTRTIVRGAEIGQPVVTVRDGSEAPVVVVLSGIALSGAVGPCTEPGGCAHGLLVTGSAKVDATDCTFAENDGTGVVVREGARAVIRNSTIAHNNAFGVQVTGQADVELVAVTITNHRGTAVWVGDEGKLQLTRSTANGCEGHGGWVRERGHLTATSTTISGCSGHGLWAQDQARAELTDCKLVRHGGAGVRAEHAAEIALTGCTLEGTWDGVEARDSTRVRVLNSAVSQVRWDGIKLSGAASAEIRGSVLAGGRGSGVSLSGSAQAEIRTNRIEAWVTSGVLALSRFPPLGEANNFRDNGADLVGNVPGSLRAPLVAPFHAEVRFPGPGYTSLQEALDAVLPGGRLVVGEGTHQAGVTVGKPVRIEAEVGVTLTPRTARESPVLSLVGGADLELTGGVLAFGSEGLIMGGEARAVLTDCVLADNERGVHVADEATLSLVRCRLSRNEQGGIWLWGRSRATLSECVLAQNGVCGVGVGGSATLSIVGCDVVESGWNGGIVLRDSAQAEIRGNSFSRNLGFGVALYHGLCLGGRYRFSGRVWGGGNAFSSNYKGNFCPDELDFLPTEWGELDLRP